MSEHLQLIGPRIQPIRRWLTGFAVLALCGLFLASGLSGGFPHWLQSLGWAVFILIWIGGSGYLLWRTVKDRRARFGQLEFLPASWRRWLLDETESKLVQDKDR